MLLYPRQPYRNGIGASLINVMRQEYFEHHIYDLKAGIEGLDMRSELININVSSFHHSIWLIKAPSAKEQQFSVVLTRNAPLVRCLLFDQRLIVESVTCYGISLPIVAEKLLVFGGGIKVDGLPHSDVQRIFFEIFLHCVLVLNRALFLLHLLLGLSDTKKGMLALASSQWAWHLNCSIQLYIPHIHICMHVYSTFYACARIYIQMVPMSWYCWQKKCDRPALIMDWCALVQQHPDNDFYLVEGVAKVIELYQSQTPWASVLASAHLCVIDRKGNSAWYIYKKKERGNAKIQCAYTLRSIYLFMYYYLSWLVALSKGRILGASRWWPE